MDSHCSVDVERLEMFWDLLGFFRTSSFVGKLLDSSASPATLPDSDSYSVSTLTCLTVDVGLRTCTCWSTGWSSPSGWPRGNLMECWDRFTIRIGNHLFSLFIRLRARSNPRLSSTNGSKTASWHPWSWSGSSGTWTIISCSGGTTSGFGLTITTCWTLTGCRVTSQATQVFLTIKPFRELTTRSWASSISEPSNKLSGIEATYIGHWNSSSSIWILVMATPSAANFAHGRPQPVQL